MIVLLGYSIYIKLNLTIEQWRYMIRYFHFHSSKIPTIRTSHKILSRCP